MRADSPPRGTGGRRCSPTRFRHASLLSIWLTAEEKARFATADVAGPGQLASTGLFGKGERP